MAYCLALQYKLHHNYPARLPCGTAGMTGEGGIRTGKVGACFLLLCLGISMCVDKCVCVIV